MKTSRILHIVTFFLAFAVLSNLHAQTDTSAAKAESNEATAFDIDPKKAKKLAKKRERFEKRWQRNLDRSEYYHEKGYYKTANFLMKTWARKESKRKPNSTLMAASLLARSKYLEGLGQFNRSKEIFYRGIFLLDSNRLDPKYRMTALILASESKQEMAEFYHAYYLALLAKYENR